MERTTDSSSGETQALLGERLGLGVAQSEEDLIDLSGADHPLNPMNMPTWRKWWCACFLGLMTFAATFASSVFNPAIPTAAAELNTSIETMALATSLFVFGFAAGPILMGPGSELYV